jgi:hypothetical protein
MKLARAPKPNSGGDFRNELRVCPFALRGVGMKCAHASARNPVKLVLRQVYVVEIDGAELTRLAAVCCQGSPISDFSKPIPLNPA